MLAIRATYHDRQSETGVPAVFRIEGKRLLISHPDGSAIAAWKCRDVRMLSGPAQGQPLRLCESGNSLVYLAPENAVNLSWLASLCPKLGPGLADPVKPERRKPALVRATKSIIPQVARVKEVAKVKGFGKQRREVLSEPNAAEEPVKKSRKARIFLGLVLLGAIGFLGVNFWEGFKQGWIDGRDSDLVVCRSAIDTVSEAPWWRTDEAAKSYVLEAKRRGLTSAACARIIVANRMAPALTPRTAEKAETPKVDPRREPVVITTNVRAMTDKDICAGVKFGHPEYLAEAFQRGLEAASCRRTEEGKLHVLRIPKDIRNMSAIGLCKNALRRQQNEYAWDGRTPVAKYVLEAKQRGYSAYDCFRIIDPDIIKPEIAAKPNVVVCRNALKPGSGKPQWRTDGEAHEYVKVARDRGLTAAACTRIAIASSRAPVAAAPAATKKTRATGKAVDHICRMATLRDDEKIIWDERFAVKVFVEEARLRGLTLNNCARIIGWKPAVKPAMSATGKPDDHVCRMATVQDDGKLAWDERFALKNFVDEARNRGLSLAYCTRIIDWKTVPRKKKPPLTAETSDQDICLERRRGNFNAIREAKRRGLSSRLCRDAADWRSATSPGDTFDARLRDADLCRAALDLRGGEVRWDPSEYQYAYVLEAKKRGMEIADCRRLVE